MEENKLEKKRSTFDILNEVNVSSKVKEKIGLSYLSWSDAWSEIKKLFPDASYTVYTRDVESTTTETVTYPATGVEPQKVVTVVSKTINPVPYFTDGRTCYVKVGVTVDGVEMIEQLPIMDNRNNAVSISTLKMTEVNKSIQRATVKACARHGLGLYVYSGEDLPENDRKKPFNLKSTVTDFEKSFAKPNGTTITEEQYNKEKDYVISFLKGEVNAGEDLPNLITPYLSKCSGGRRIPTLVSTSAEDRAIMRTIFSFIQFVVKKETAAL